MGAEKKNDVVVVLTAAGDELIGEFIVGHMDSITLKGVMRLHTQTDETGGMITIMMPWSNVLETNQSIKLLFGGLVSYFIVEDTHKMRYYEKIAEIKEKDERLNRKARDAEKALTQKDIDDMMSDSNIIPEGYKVN